MTETTAVNSDLDTVKSDLTKLRSDMSSLKESVQGFATDRVRTKISEAQQHLDKITDQARSRSRQSLEDLSEEIEERPLTSILLAFGVGVILGRLFD